MKEYKKQAMKMQMICFLILLWLVGGVPLSDLVMRMYLKEVNFLSALKHDFFIFQIKKPDLEVLNF